MKNLLEFVHQFGQNPAYVTGGGSSASVKEGAYLYVRNTSIPFSALAEEDFVKMSAARLNAVWDYPYSSQTDERESEVLAALMGATLDFEKRPSAEALLHTLLPQKYVVQTNASLVNGLTCAKMGAEKAKALFGGEAVWMPMCGDAFALAKAMRDALSEFKTETGRDAKIIFLQNRGLLVAADSTAEIAEVFDRIFKTISDAITETPDFSPTETDRAFAAEIAPMLRMQLWGEGSGSVVTFFTNAAVMDLIKDTASFAAVSKAFTPAQVICAGASAMFVEKADSVEEQFAVLEEGIKAFREANGYSPRLIAIAGLGVFAHGCSKKAADNAKALFLDAIKISAFASAFGGAERVDALAASYIQNSKLENPCAGKTEHHGRAYEKILVVTGSAQGFGQGIAESVLGEGANVVIADLNEALAMENAAKLSITCGANKAVAVKVDVGSEESVKEMYIDAMLAFGGIDALINNAGIVRAGSLEEMTVPMLDLVTKVNYTAYFLCAKYAAKYMKIQSRFAKDYFMDIIQINSKSGLAGSNKNFAYAGSKFGGIGLTQSFALELTPFQIKVNSICPGNFLEGPLWMDPEKGLFVQYLNAGKVPGAKTVDDVRRAYEAKVPMNRGCRVADVVRAIYYCMEQEYETGQAIPVTGGQEMLN